MSQIVNIAISSIDANPFRMLGKYPYVEKKLEALQRSIKEVGLWEGVIARQVPNSNRYELAFGHHRVEAARRNKLRQIPVILRELADKEMLQFMGRENGEDYNADFLALLETWEAAVNFSTPRGANTYKPLNIARVLGWTRPRPSGKQEGQDVLTHTASACHSAYALINGGYLAREDLAEMSVRSAKEIVERAQARMEQLEKMAKETQRPRKETEQAKKHVAKGAKATAKKVQAQEVAVKDIRAQVDVEAYRSAARSKDKQMPLFAAFGKALVGTVEKMLDTDSAGKRLNEVAEVVNKLTLESDVAILRQLDFYLGEVNKRSVAWQKRLTPTSEKVVSLVALEDKREA